MKHFSDSLISLQHKRCIYHMEQLPFLIKHYIHIAAYFRCDIHTP